MTATPSAPVIDLVDLKIEAKSNDQWSKIVNGVSLSIRPGEVLGLVGESGAGKSTVGLAALGYFRPGAKVTGGEVRLLGQNILDIPEEERRKFRGTKVAYVAQSAQAAFNPAYRLMDQIIMVAVDRGGLTREAAQKRALDLFHALQLPDPRNFGKRYPHQVSGGQLQRAMVAMAMICNPALIIFDEPTTALDVTTQVEVLISIRKVIEDYRVAAIYITHDLAVVAQVAHRVAVLRYGEVVEEAPIAQIMERPTHPYTKSLWAVHEMPVGQGDRHGKGAPLLAVTGLGAHYGDFQVLTAIDLDVGRGETVALVGESGSGKSTLGRVIVGLKEVSSGQVVYEGKPLPGTIRRRSLEMLKQIQIIYQSADTALNPRQTVRKIIGRPLTLYQGLRTERDAYRSNARPAFGWTEAAYRHRPRPCRGPEADRLRRDHLGPGQGGSGRSAAHADAAAGAPRCLLSLHHARYRGGARHR